MSLVLKLDSQPRAAFYQRGNVLSFIEPQYQPFRGLLKTGELRRVLEVGGRAELPNVDVELDNGQDQHTDWFRVNPPFRARGELSELRDGRLDILFVGSVLSIELGSIIKLTLES